ncbi:Abscisic acid receptor like [Actinidia chinensis var. chinensis]|uniref:Abscisic acid receptor like n=1 Tax=Actinidia chinensis var. chinensis TaxID=1590841 RepID=A0A2R6RR61_ACTCC|nr:Abscisic acid receptor like [Actinidia chinensis var. chinensis]
MNSSLQPTSKGGRERERGGRKMHTSLQLHRINTTATSAAAAAVAISHYHKPSQTIWRPPFSVPDDAIHHHTHAVGPGQCCSAVVQNIAAPVAAVWPLVRRFDNPQAYKHFLKSCHVIDGDGDVGSLREVHVVSGLPAGSSTERLEILDDDRHVISFSVVGGDHRLKNYRSLTTLHQSPTGSGTVVIESYVVDVPPGNTKDETCVFADTIVRCNLQSLAQIAEDLAKNNSESP